MTAHRFSEIARRRYPGDVKGGYAVSSAECCVYCGGAWEQVEHAPARAATATRVDGAIGRVRAATLGAGLYPVCGTCNAAVGPHPSACLLERRRHMERRWKMPAFSAADTAFYCLCPVCVDGVDLMMAHAQEAGAAV